jgi:DNA-binding beta-propeller fold protein YncE
VVDAGQNRLVSFDRNGTMLRAFTADGRLKAPFDMVRLDNGKLWVVEKGRNSLTLIDIGAKQVKPHTVRDGQRQVFPDRIAQSRGTLYVLDRASGQVLRLGAELNVEQRYGCPDCIGGLADFVLSGNTVWALEPRSKQVFHFADDGSILRTVKLGGEVDFPVSLEVESDDTIYILDRHQNSVLAYSQDGSFRYRFLGSGHAHGQVHFARQLRFDPWGRLCVVDEGGGRVEIFSR